MYSCTSEIHVNKRQTEKKKIGVCEACVFVSEGVSMRMGMTDRHRKRRRDRDTERDRERQRDRGRQRQTERDREKGWTREKSS